jgi:hypothetical protein
MKIPFGLHYLLEFAFAFVIYHFFGFNLTLLWYVINIEVNTYRVAKGWNND